MNDIVLYLSGSALRGSIESIGAQFHAFPAGADFDLRDFGSVAPELKRIPPGPDWLRVAMERVFVDAIPAQHRGLQQVLRGFPADVIIDLDFTTTEEAQRFLAFLKKNVWSSTDTAPALAGTPQTKLLQQAGAR